MNKYNVKLFLLLVISVMVIVSGCDNSQETSKIKKEGLNVSLNTKEGHKSKREDVSLKAKTDSNKPKEAVRGKAILKEAKITDQVEKIAPNLPTPLKSPISETGFVLGTVVTINLYDQASEDLFAKIFARLREIHSEMTINGEDSEIIGVNSQAGKDYVKLSEDTYYVVEQGKYYSELSGGRFDITIGPLVKAWNIGTESAKVPSQVEIYEKLKLVNYKDLLLDEQKKSVKLNKKGMILDLGAIAKGYAADEVVKILKENNINRGIINLGGNVYAYGAKTEDTPWRIGIQNPLSPRGDYLGILKVENKTIVTSGIYERFFEENGKKYHHILDPETGYPVENDLASVAIITESSIKADALSTSIFSAGLERGKVLIEKLDNVEALFVTKECEVYITSGLINKIEITDNNFKLMK